MGYGVQLFPFCTSPSCKGDKHSRWHISNISFFFELFIKVPPNINMTEIFERGEIWYEKKVILLCTPDYVLACQGQYMAAPYHPQLPICFKFVFTTFFENLIPYCMINNNNKGEKGKGINLSFTFNYLMVIWITVIIRALSHIARVFKKFKKIWL